MNSSPPPRLFNASAAAVIVWVAAVAFFAPTLACGFVYDDQGNILQNPSFRGLTGDHLRWMFTDLGGGHYMPLTWLTLAWDHAIGGLEPAGYHLTNTLLHGFNAVLVYVLALLFLTRAPSIAGVRRAALFGALLYGLHPQRVESVAWVTERRDLLAGFFALASFLTALRSWSAPRPGPWTLLSLICFAASLLSKSIAIALPLVLWTVESAFPPASPRSPRTRFFTIVPYFALAAAAGWLAIRGQETSDSLREATPWLVRMTESGTHLWFHWWKMIWPTNLTFYITYESSIQAHDVVAFVAAALVSVVLWIRRMRNPGLFATWWCSALLLGPTLGLVRFSSHFAADRNTYLPAIPWAVAAAVLVHRGYQRVSRSKKSTLQGGAVVLLLLLGTLSILQTRVWRDERTLWDHVLSIDDRNYFAFKNRGAQREREGDLRGAKDDYDAAITVKPDYAGAYFNRGNTHRQMGMFPQMLQDYNSAIHYDPTMTKAYVNRGIAYDNPEQYPLALENFGKALELEPHSLEALTYRGILLRRLGRHEEGRRDLELARQLAPKDSPFLRLIRNGLKDSE